MREKEKELQKKKKKGENLVVMATLPTSFITTS